MKSIPLNETFSLRRNFSWTLVGNVVYSICQWGMLIVLAKLGTPEMVGEFTFALAVTAPLFMFTNLQLRVVQATDAHNQYRFNDYMGLRLVATGIALLVLLPITQVLPHSESVSLVIGLMGLAKGIESISDVCYGWVQHHERMDLISISLLIKGPLSLIFLTIGVLISSSVVGGVVGLVLAWAILLFSYDLSMVQRLVKILRLQDFSSIMPRWHWPTQRKLVALTLPLGFVMLLVSLNTNIPRYFIEHYLSPRDLGIFAAIAYLMLVGSIIQGAMAQAASPRLAKYYADGSRGAFIGLLLKLIGMSIFLGFMAILISWLCGKQILTLVYNPEYAQYTELLIWLMGAATLEYISSFLGTATTSARYFRSQVPLLLCTASILSITCLYSIPVWGLKGIAFAMVGTGIVRIVLFLALLIHAMLKPIAVREIQGHL